MRINRSQRSKNLLILITWNTTICFCKNFGFMYKHTIFFPIVRNYSFKSLSMSVILRANQGFIFFRKCKFLPYLIFSTLLVLSFFPVSCTHFHCSVLNFFPNFTLDWTVTLPPKVGNLQEYIPLLRACIGKNYSRIWNGILSTHNKFCVFFKVHCVCIELLHAWFCRAL